MLPVAIRISHTECCDKQDLFYLSFLNGLDMAVAANKSLSSTPSPLTPNNRKCCNVCSKRIYLHQPVLVCGNCSDAYHGKCLGLINYDIFNLQQTEWFCDLCSKTNNLKCYACNLSIELIVQLRNSENYRGAWPTLSLPTSPPMC